MSDYKIGRGDYLVLKRLAGSVHDPYLVSFVEPFCVGAEEGVELCLHPGIAYKRSLVLDNDVSSPMNGVSVGTVLFSDIRFNLEHFGLAEGDVNVRKAEEMFEL